RGQLTPPNAPKVGGHGTKVRVTWKTVYIASAEESKFRGQITDRIVIEGLKVFGRHGVAPHERDQGQDYLIDVECGLDATRAAASDRLEDTVDYSALIRSISEVVGGESFYLLEALGEAVAARALVYPRVEMVRVAIFKPALSGDELKAVGVVVERSREQAGERSRP
ncbi:MAG: dihydroneopterin aldolase, partial [Actinomycetota bacterium]